MVNRTVKTYIKANEQALKENNPCSWRFYADDPARAWSYIAHLIGEGLRAYPPEEVAARLKDLYPLVCSCCIDANMPVPFDAATFLAWVNERYQPNQREAAGEVQP